MTVYQMQCLLAYLGYSPGVIDGVDGAKTQGALARFRRDYGAGEEGLVEAVAGNLQKREPEDFWEEIEFFDREEFACKCGGRYCDGYPAQMKEGAVRIADAARKHFGRPGHVVSGLRCKIWNEMQGGVWNSQHQYGEAVDLRIEGVSAEELRQFVAAQPGHRYSYCINSTNVHFDIPKEET